MIAGTVVARETELDAAFRFVDGTDPVPRLLVLEGDAARLADTVAELAAVRASLAAESAEADSGEVSAGADTSGAESDGPSETAETAGGRLAS